MALKDEIRKFALQNALKFDGKASAGALIGRILGEHEELRSKPKEAMKQIQEVVKEVNKLGIEKQKQELEAIAPELLEKREKQKKDLPELKDAIPGKIVTRIPPEPSKYNHIGHALSFLINYLYAKKYNGKCVLRYEDTNPEKAKQVYVDAMNEDVLNFLEIKPDRVVYVSDDMPRFYELAEQLISKGKSYVCTCDRDLMQKNRHEGRECSCRANNAEKSMKLWKDMLGKRFKDGEAVLRLAIDMKAENQVMRDPVIMRICTTPHFRQGSKFAVWPMYDFENAVEEELCGITHILRSSEFGMMRVELQNYIKDLFGFKKQVVVQYGRFQVENSITQGREIRELIESGKISGWDDPRLITIRALRRRGFAKEMFYDLALEVGVSASTQKMIEWDAIYAINKRYVDPVANRFFFIKDPVKIVINGAPEQIVELDLHPKSKPGGRKMKSGENFYLEKQDFDGLKPGKLYRLMGCLNFAKKGKEFVFDSLEHEKFKDEGELIMHWLPQDSVINVEVLMDNGFVVKGFGEKNLEIAKAGDVVQFERHFFARLEKREKNKFYFIFAHP